VTLPGGKNALRLVVARPQSFEQVGGLAENLKGNRPLVVNLEELSPEEARRVVDFLSGATFALGGAVRKITAGIFLFTPSNVDLAGDLEDFSPSAPPWWVSRKT